jgi:hypothetical protein
MKYYRAELWGYGESSKYLSIEKIAYSYWYRQTVNGNHDNLVDHLMGNPINDLPPYANLHSANILGVSNGIYLSCSQLSIYEIDNNDISANIIGSIIENINVDSFLTSKNLANTKLSPNNPYIVQYIEAQRGIFWQCIFSSESIPSTKDFSFDATQYYSDEKILQGLYYRNNKIESVLNNVTTTGNFVKLWKT